MLLFIAVVCVQVRKLLANCRPAAPPWPAPAAASPRRLGSAAAPPPGQSPAPFGQSDSAHITILLNGCLTSLKSLKLRKLID